MVISDLPKNFKIVRQRSCLTWIPILLMLLTLISQLMPHKGLSNHNHFFYCFSFNLVLLSYNSQHTLRDFRNAGSLRKATSLWSRIFSHLMVAHNHRLVPHSESHNLLLSYMSPHYLPRTPQGDAWTRQFLGDSLDTCVPHPLHTVWKMVCNNSWNRIQNKITLWQTLRNEHILCKTF